MSNVVFIPGLACDGEVWADVLDALALPRPAVISDAGFRADTLPGMAAQLLADHAGPLTLVGHSMGAMVALHAALQAPHRVRSLALLATTARADTPELIALRTAACERFAAGEIDAVLSANVMFAFHPGHARNAALVQRYIALVKRAGADALIRQNQAVMARPDLRADLHRITCPALVVVGEGDGLTPPEAARELADALPRAEAHVLAGCGHMLTLERPDAVAALLADWRDRSLPG